MSAESIYIAKLLAIPSGFILGSYNAVFSQNVIQYLYPLPASTATPIFDKIFHRGGSTIIPIASLGIMANVWLAYNSESSKQRLHGAAALLIASSLPFTKLVMGAGINRLLEISSSTALQQSPGINEEVVRLLTSWRTHNSIRSSLHFVAGLLSLSAII